MKKLFFDSGPIISLVISRLGWVLPLLKQQFGGTFYITPAVKHELVDRPLTVRRFEFEALEVMKLIREGVLTIYPEVPWDTVKKLSAVANNSFTIAGNPLKIVQEGEMESVACALKEQVPVVVDERTLRIVIEDCSRMKKLLELRFQRDVAVNKPQLNQAHRLVKKVAVIRSAELVAIGYKSRLLDSYLPPLKQGRKILLEAVLWSVKYSGCAITEHEIEEIRDLLLKK